MYDERHEFDERYKYCISLGITHDEFMRMDIRHCAMAVEGKLMARENAVNDFKDLFHKAAHKFGAAMTGDKSFGTPIDKFRLRNETRAEKLAASANEMGLKEADIITFVKRGEKNGR